MRPLGSLQQLPQHVFSWSYGEQLRFILLIDLRTLIQIIDRPFYNLAKNVLLVYVKEDIQINHSGVSGVLENWSHISMMTIKIFVPVDRVGWQRGRARCLTCKCSSLLSPCCQDLAGIFFVSDVFQ